jgi:26S proteasome regulatory subunit N2
MMEHYKSILSGQLATQLYSEFLYRMDHTDATIIRNMKTWVEMRSSVHQTAVIIANAIMRFGTFNMQFLKENVELLRRQTHWGRFNAVATAGLIFRGHHKHAMSLLQPHLAMAGHSDGHFGGTTTTTTTTTTGHSEGGAYFALGLIHSHHGHKIKKELLNNLKTMDNENTQHGIALGLAVAAFSTADEEVYDALKNILYMDNAISGEAAGYAMGLIMCDRENDTAFLEMLEYARETQHEKIIRGLAMGLAFMMYGRQHHAQSRIEELCADKDPLIRYGGMYMCGLAYAGTSSNEAIRRLLHYAVSDVSPDVRRAAVTCIGFVMFREPKQCPKMVQLLSESFNPHVRYGAAIALGIACLGSGLQEAIDILQVLVLDMIDFVRQGALLALGMVLIQHNEASSSEMSTIRKLYDKVISERHEDTMAKLGAILGQGIMDAGGRNCTIALQSKLGHLNKMGIVGVAMFLQYWYWHPLLCFIGMSLEPTGLIALSPRLVMPKVQFGSHILPALTAYPLPISIPVTPVPQKVPTAVLSTTGKTRLLRAKKERRSSQLLLDPSTSSSTHQMMIDTTTTQPDETSAPTTPPPPKSPQPAEPHEGRGDMDKATTTIIPPTTPTTTPTTTLTPTTMMSSSDGGDGNVGLPPPSSSSEIKKKTPIKTIANTSSSLTIEERRTIAESSTEKEETMENPTRILPRYLRHVYLVSDRYEEDRFRDLYGIVVLRDKRPYEDEATVSFTIPTMTTTGSNISSSMMTSDEPPMPEPFELPEELLSQ